jgi:hypothetical protein
MPILKDILSESREYYFDLEKRLKARLAQLPKGSLLKRRIGKQDYYYLKFRQEGKVISKYLGKHEPEGLAKDIKERRLIERQLKEVRENLRMIGKVRGKKADG